MSNIHSVRKASVFSSSHKEQDFTVLGTQYVLRLYCSSPTKCQYNFLRKIKVIQLVEISLNFLLTLSLHWVGEETASA